MNFLDLIILGVIGLSTLLAFSRGFVKELLSILGCIGAVIATIAFFTPARAIVRQYIAEPLLADIAAGMYAYTNILNAIILRGNGTLLNTSSTLARLAGLRWPEPLKITSCMLSPRSSLALLSPSTQRTASMMLDLPQPLGPTTPTRWPGNWKVVGSAKDLKPESLIWFRRMQGAEAAAQKAIHLRKSLIYKGRLSAAHFLSKLAHGLPARKKPGNTVALYF